MKATLVGGTNIALIGHLKRSVTVGFGVPGFVRVVETFRFVLRVEMSALDTC